MLGDVTLEFVQNFDALDEAPGPVHALEAIAHRLTAEHRYAQAISAALCAVRLDPLRESAHRAAIAVHIAEGNHSEAIRQYTTYTTLLDTQLGLTPSPQIQNLINPTP